MLVSELLRARMFGDYKLTGLGLGRYLEALGVEEPKLMLLWQDF